MRFFGAAKFENTITKQVFMLSDDAIIVLDGNLEIVMFNQEAENIFGYKLAEVQGQPFSLLVPESLRQEYQGIINRFVADRSTRRQLNEKGNVFTGLRKSGEEFQTRTSLVKSDDGRNPVYILTVRDISDDQKTEEELLKLATTDPLTGVYNRREFIIQAERESRRARRYNRALSVMILDIDNFKAFNALYGHAAGDKALQRVTNICCNTLRNVDLFGRWSGGEFIALLPETSAENGMIIAERLRRLIGDYDIEHEGEKIRCTVSIGIAEFKKNENTLDNPVARAMSAVNQAKQGGRNRVSGYKE